MTTFDPKKPSKQENGLKARFLGYLKSKSNPLAFAIESICDGEIYELVTGYTEDGKYNINTTTHYDLINYVPCDHITLFPATEIKNHRLVISGTVGCDFCPKCGEKLRET